MRLRFTIRDLLWLTVVVALATGWWLDHRRLAVEPFKDDLQLVIGGGMVVHEMAADLSADELAKLREQIEHETDEVKGDE